MEQTLDPLHGHILVKEGKEKKTETGLILSVGEENPRLNGGVVTAQAKEIEEEVVGKYVVFPAGSGEKVWIKHEGYRLIPFASVMAWREGTEEEAA